MVGYLPSSPLTAVLLDFLCTPKIDLQNFNSSFSKQCLSNNSYLSHSILKTWSLCFYKGPPNFTGICADRPDKGIVQMQAQFGWQV